MAVLTTRHVALRRSAGTYTPASSGFLAIADSTDHAEILCVTLSVRAKGTNPELTVRLSDREFTDSDGNRWNALIHEKSTLDAGGTFIESRWQPADFDLVVADAKLNVQGMAYTFSDLLWQYELVGTPVRVQLGAEGLATASWQDILTEAEVSEVADLTPTEVRLIVVQNRKWIRPVPTAKVERNAYPDAPPDSVGMPVPLFLGNFSSGRVLMSSLPSPCNIAAYKAGVARAPIPMVPIDGGADGGQPAYLVSSDDIYTPALEYLLIYDSTVGRLAGTPYCSLSQDTEGNYVNTLTGANFSKFELAILATDAHPTNNTCDNWLESSRTDKDYTLSGYASLDYDADKKVLEILLPDIRELGTFDSATVYMWYAKNATTVTHPRFGLKHADGDSLEDLDAAASSGYPSDTPLDRDDVLAASITAWEKIAGGSLFAEVREAGSKLQVHRIVLLVKYVPAMSLIHSTAPTQTPQRFTVTGRKDRGYTSTPVFYGYYKLTPGVDVFSFDAPAYTYQVGVPDDGSGTYTGTASAVIERPGDIAHYLLRTYGSMGASNITTAASTFGSFTDLRTTLANYKAQVYIGDATDVEDVVAEIGRQFMVWFYRRLHAADAPWVAVPWGGGGTVNYRTTTNQFVFTKRYLAGMPSVGLSRVSGVRNIVRVNYDYDLRTRTYSEQCFISDTDSRGWTGSTEARDMETTRELLAAESVALYGRREHVINLSMCNDPATATSIRNRAFDLFYRPRVEVRFTTFLNACDLERGMSIQLGDDLDSIMPYPLAGSDGSWLGRPLQVCRVTRREAAATTYDVEAVEL